MTAGALAAIVVAGSRSTSSDKVSIDDSRTTLLGYIIEARGQLSWATKLITRL